MHDQENHPRSIQYEQVNFQFSGLGIFLLSHVHYIQLPIPFCLTFIFHFPSIFLPLFPINPTRSPRFHQNLLFIIPHTSELCTIFQPFPSEIRIPLSNPTSSSRSYGIILNKERLGQGISLRSKGSLWDVLRAGWQVDWGCRYPVWPKWATRCYEKRKDCSMGIEPIAPGKIEPPRVMVTR